MSTAPDLSQLTEDDLTREYTAVIEALAALDDQTAIAPDDAELVAETARLNARALELHIESARRRRNRTAWESLKPTPMRPH